MEIATKRRFITEIERILVLRDGMTYKQASDEMAEMKGRVREGEDPEEILHEIGLEPDYVFDLLY